MQSTFRYDVHAGTATDAYAGTGELTFTWEGDLGLTRIIEMAVWDNPAEIIMSYDGIVYGPPIELDQDDPPVQIPHAARAIQIRNKLTGANSRFQIVGFW